MIRELTEDNACRLAKALIQRYGITYEEAMYKLAAFRLNLVCDQTIARSDAMQAALITAINVGKRAFHGGVHVVVPGSIPTRFPWPGQPTLREVCASLGARLGPCDISDVTQTIFFCLPRNAAVGDLFASATGWRGGVSQAIAPVAISSPVDFALGGIFAGALAVAKGFLHVSGIDTRHYNELSGTSLWDPEADWVHGSSDGPGLLYLPQKLWILGLGHLGQAYLWSLGSLPYAEPRKAQLMLQDFDRAVEANLGTGMLCTEQSVGILKTRVCSDWLERRGLQTTMVERRFDAGVVPHENDPLVALCAFDSAASRSILEKPGFDLVVEAGIGGDLGNFDHVFLHTFPGAAKEPGDIWPTESNTIVEPELVEAFHLVERCGVVAETLAGKAISSAFVGAIAGSLVVAEVLRGLHGGKRSEFLRFQVRRDSRPTVVYLREQYQLRFARSGYILANTRALNAGPPVVTGIATSKFSKLAHYCWPDHAQQL